MVTVIEIRDQVEAWLKGRTSFRQFEDWLVDAAGVIAAQNDLAAESLIDEIDGLLSEYSDRVLSAVELRNGMEAAIRPFVQAAPLLPYALAPEFF